MGRDRADRGDRGLPRRPVPRRGRALRGVRRGPPGGRRRSASTPATTSGWCRPTADPSPPRAGSHWRPRPCPARAPRRHAAAARRERGRGRPADAALVAWVGAAAPGPAGWPPCARGRSWPPRPAPRRPPGHHPLGPRRELAAGTPRSRSTPTRSTCATARCGPARGSRPASTWPSPWWRTTSGTDVSQLIARWLVMFLHRPGGQTQFATPVWAPRARRSAVREVQSRVEADPGGDHRVATLAGAAAMSERHFARVFTAEVGETPSRYVERVRTEAARRELESTGDTLDVIAARCGFGTAETLRRAFQRRLHCSPDAYRRRFATTPPERTRPDRPHPRRSPSHSSTGSPPSTPSAPTRSSSASPRSTWSSSATETGEVRSDNRMLGITRDATFEEVPAPDVLVFPGGFGTRALEHDERVLDWVRAVHRTSHYTTSVCTGSLVLAAAGLLDGLTATTHWAAYAELEALRGHRGGRTGGRAPRPADHHRGRGVERHRHGPAAGRAAGRPDRGRSRPAHDRVRPAATGLLGLGGDTSDATMARVIEYASAGPPLSPEPGRQEFSPSSRGRVRRRTRPARSWPTASSVHSTGRRRPAGGPGRWVERVGLDQLAQQDPLGEGRQSTAASCRESPGPDPPADGGPARPRRGPCTVGSAARCPPGTTSTIGRVAAGAAGGRHVGDQRHLDGGGEEEADAQVLGTAHPDQFGQGGPSQLRRRHVDPGDGLGAARRRCPRPPRRPGRRRGSGRHRVWNSSWFSQMRPMTEALVTRMPRVSATWDEHPLERQVFGAAPQPLGQQDLPAGLEDEFPELLP